MSTRLTGKTALVTGSTSGLGRAIAVALASEGARVVVSGRDKERGAATVRQIVDAGGRAEFIAADLSAGAGAAQDLAVSATSALGGVVDILVNNAAIFPGATTAATDEATFDAVYTVNVKAPLFLTGVIGPAMAERGSGAIVNIGSWVALRGMPSALYASSKAAVESLTKAWTAEFGPSGVRVNAVSPGVIATDGTAPNRELQDGIAAGTPAGRIGLPEEVAAAVVFLASDEAAFIQGAILPVDGGKLAV
jgi:NAD(P)-dependent dehydrogenase (short-subunit alcohol dehydrogenase family)